MRRRRFERPSFAHALVIFLLVRPSPLRPGEESLDLAKVKELEAKEKLQRLEETMDRLATLLAESEPQNAAKLRRAFQESRQRLVLQRMDRVIQYLQEKKIDRALEAAQGGPPEPRRADRHPPGGRRRSPRDPEAYPEAARYSKGT